MIQEDCCVLLRNLTSDKIGRHRLVLTKGITQILASMSTFQDDALLQSDGCDALLSIIESQGDVENDLPIEIVDVTGASMVLHKHNPSVEYSGRFHLRFPLLLTAVFAILHIGRRRRRGVESIHCSLLFDVFP